MSTAMAAYKEKILTAGMSMTAPRKKATDSEIPVNNIDGATWPTMRPI